MDILAQYQKEHPEMKRAVEPYGIADEYGWIVRFVIKLSGGRIRSARHATWVLGGIVVLVLGATAAIFIANFDILPPERFSEEEAAKQLEIYRKVQPF